MDGYIISYLEEKKFGFITGDNGKKYFFHKNDFIDKSLHIEDKLNVSFEEMPTKKGYSAKKINVITVDIEVNDINPFTKKTKSTTENLTTYIVPDEVYISKESEVRSWETIERSNWIISSSSRDLDEAKRELQLYANSLAGNAIVDMKTVKNTQSEITYRGGIYKYTVWDLSGTVVNIGKRSFRGTYTKKSFLNIDEMANALWNAGVVETKKSFKHGLIFLSIMGVILTYTYFFKIPSVDMHFLLELFSNPIPEEKRNGIVVFFIGVFSAFLAKSIFFQRYNQWLRKIG